MTNITYIYEMKSGALPSEMIGNISSFKIDVINEAGVIKSKSLFKKRKSQFVSQFVGILSYQRQVFISLPKHLARLSLTTEQKKNFSKILVATLKRYDEETRKRRRTRHTIFDSEKDVIEISCSVSAQLGLLNDYYHGLTYSAEITQTESSGSGTINWGESEQYLMVNERHEAIYLELMTDRLVNDEQNGIVIIYRKLIQYCYNELKDQGIADILGLSPISIEPTLNVLQEDLESWGRIAKERLLNENLDNNKKILRNIINVVDGYHANVSSSFQFYGNLDFCYIWEAALADVLRSSNEAINRGFEYMKLPNSRTSQSKHKLDVFFQEQDIAVIADAKYMDIRNSFVALSEVTKQYMYEVAVRHWFETQSNSSQETGSEDIIGQLHNVLLFPQNSLSGEYVSLPNGSLTIDDSDVEILYIKNHLSLSPIRCLLVNSERLFSEYTGQYTLNDDKLRTCLLGVLDSSSSV